LESSQVLRHCTGEFRQPPGSLVGVFVDCLVRCCGAEAEVGRDVDDPGPGSPLRSGLENGVDQLRRAGNQRLYFGLRLEARIAVCGRKMRECFGNEPARLAVGHHGSEPEARMSREQAQELTGHVTRATEHDCRNGCLHAADSRTRPIVSMTRSPSAAPALSALKAGTPSWVVMISTPT